MRDLRSLPGYADATQSANAYRSPRFWALDEFESFVAGSQYEGRPSWWSQDVPLWERAPCIVYPIVRSAIQSNTDLVLGEGRFPALTSRAEVESSDTDDANDAAVSAADAAVEAASDEARYRPVMRQAFEAAQGCGTACVLVGARDGRRFAETVRAKWCEPDLGVDGSVDRLVIQYPYLDAVKVRGEWRVRALLYRREIDAKSDVTYRPAEADTEGRDPTWQRDPGKSIEHGLGFCPAVWYPFMRGCSTVNQIDGKPVHWNLLDELQALDFSLSQRHRAALWLGEPQVVEIGVAPGYNPTGSGRAADVPATSDGREIYPGAPPTAHYVDPAARREAARKKGPGYVWQYTNDKARVELLTLPEGALGALDAHIQDLRIKIAESLAVVFMDPESVKYAAALSGKALETLRARQLDRCDQYRDDVADGLLIPTMQLLLRVGGRIGA